MEEGCNGGEADNSTQLGHVEPRSSCEVSKRRRVSGNEGTELGEKLHDGLVETIDCNNRENDRVDLNGRCEEPLEMECGSNKDFSCDINSESREIDLNAGLGLHLNEELDFSDLVDVRVDYEHNLDKIQGCADLNIVVESCDMDGNGGFVSKSQKIGGRFDLNLGVDEESFKDDSNTCIMGKRRESNSLQTALDKMKGMCVENRFSNGGLKEVYISKVSSLALAEEIMKQDGVSSNNCSVCESGEIQVKDGLSDAGAVTDGFQSDMGSPYNQGSGRRKRRTCLNNSNSVTEPLLRRSARRMSATTYVATPNSCEMDESFTSPTVSGVTEEKLVISHCKGTEEPVILPPKLQLPPSSQNFNIDGVPLLDVFSVYAFLRSFSTLLFLSPFDLEDFMGALTCESRTSLFDCIHVSILQLLQKHLGHLASEGHKPASDCLRSLDWDLLNELTWPLFVVEYLYFNSSGLKAGLNLSCLNLFTNEYCKLPVAVKVEILSCLCGNMIEVESVISELNRRSLASELGVEFNQNLNTEVSKKRRAAMDGVYLTDEAFDDSADWNSDECCLCKMDGSLLCCDGCPAAYHSKCVGIANHLLPEGDWYCPECVFDRRNKGWAKACKLVRGADPLGMDPYGRKYYSSCGYLLVLDTQDPESSSKYYHMNDLKHILNVLKSSDTFYGDLIKAIYKQWKVPAALHGATKDGNFLYSGHSYTNMKEEIPSTMSLKNPEGRLVSNETTPERKMQVSYMSSNGPAKPKQIDFRIQSSTEQAPNSFNTHKINSITISKSLEGFRTGYMNRYAFARAASLVTGELVPKLSGKKIVQSIKSAEDIILTQTKAILKKSDKFCWQNLWSLNADAWRENCGWCFFCKTPTDDGDCLFNMRLGPVRELPETDITILQSKRTKEGHLSSLICHILCIDNRLRGLLLGPWLDPQYIEFWRQSTLKASTVSCLKLKLLTLEANLPPRVLSLEWLKHVDSAVIMGSASHIIMRAPPPKNNIGKKKIRFLDSECNPTKNGDGVLNMSWWRGGRLSRQLFNWKVLPRSLVSKSARQAGRLKIPGISYPENPEFSRRCKYVAWRAAVESSTSIEQLALQVRELDLNIRWDDIENTHPLSVLDKEAKRSIRLFKKAIIRRKCIEGQNVKYLVDFGKRMNIPDVVLKNGSMVEESSSGRKKYWLNESHVPLYLLKTFEEKRIMRKSSKGTSRKISEIGRVLERSTKKRGFSYLFQRAEKLESYQCQHCNKEVPIRDAVCCEFCKGFFHRKHVKKSDGTTVAEMTFTCHRCQGGKFGKIKKGQRKRGRPKGRMGQKSLTHPTQKYKKVSIAARKSETSQSRGRPIRLQTDKRVVVNLPLRRSARRAQYVSQQIKSKKSGGSKKRKRKAKKSNHNNSKKVTCLRKKRTVRHSSYWLSGLLLSRKADDERVTQFKNDKCFVSSEGSSSLEDQPICSLCQESGSTSRFGCIACQICGEWFHGDPYGLDSGKIGRLIGFRCHSCRKRPPPICQYMISSGTDASQVAKAQNSVMTRRSTRLSNRVSSHLNQDLQGFSAVD